MYAVVGHVPLRSNVWLATRYSTNTNKRFEENTGQGGGVTHVYGQVSM
jgi:hypothetical protein